MTYSEKQHAALVSLMREWERHVRVLESKRPQTDQTRFQAGRYRQAGELVRWAAREIERVANGEGYTG